MKLSAGQGGRENKHSDSGRRKFTLPPFVVVLATLTSLAVFSLCPAKDVSREREEVCTPGNEDFSMSRRRSGKGCKRGLREIKETPRRNGPGRGWATEAKQFQDILFDIVQLSGFTAGQSQRLEGCGNESLTKTSLSNSKILVLGGVEGGGKAHFSTVQLSSSCLCLYFTLQLVRRTRQVSFSGSSDTGMDPARFSEAVCCRG